jgi:putative ABC transport system substrate-binding protein
LKNIAPNIKRIIVLVDIAGINSQKALKVVRDVAPRLGLEPTELKIEAKNAGEMKEKALLIKRSLGDALFVPPEATIVAATEAIAAQAIKENLPQVGPNVETVKRGLLAAYSSNYHSTGQQGAMLVDKVLKGAKPAELPVELPFKLHLMLNLKTASAMGLDIPKQILLQADDVVK